MSRVRIVVDVDAPPERTWEIVSNPNNLPRWDRRVASVQGVPPDGLKPGDTYSSDIRVMGVHARVDAFVKQIRPGEYAEIELSGAPLRSTVRTRLKPLDGGRRTRLEQDVEYHVRGGPVGEVLGKALQLLGASAILRKGTEAQKRQVEESVREEGW